MPPMVNRRGNASRFPTTTSTTPSETPSTPVQIQEATKMLMTHEEIKTALLEGKILYRNKKNDTRVEYKAQGDKFLRRETLPGQEPGEWTKSDIRTACKYEWNIIERKQEETEMKQEEPTTDVIRQVALGDGTSTIITEKVPVSEAPVVVDPFDNRLNRESLRPVECTELGFWERFEKDFPKMSGVEALQHITANSNCWAVSTRDGVEFDEVFRLRSDGRSIECNSDLDEEGEWIEHIDLNGFLFGFEYRVVLGAMTWKDALDAVSRKSFSSAYCPKTSNQFSNENGDILIKNGEISETDRRCVWVFKE